MTAAVAELVTVPPTQEKWSSITDIRRLHPSTFSRVETPLEVEQWMVYMKNLLEAAHIPPESRVNVVQIQLNNVARTWWPAEEARLEKLILWNIFFEGSSLGSSCNCSARDGIKINRTKTRESNY